MNVATAEDIAQDLLRAEEAYKELRVDDFIRAIDEASLDLRCLDSLIASEQAARMHRMMGLKLMAEDEQKSTMALAAAKELDPSFDFPPELLPEGHPVRQRYALAPSSSATDPVGPPMYGHKLHFDGAEYKRGRPSWRASIAQVTTIIGAVEHTAYVFPSDPLPQYPAGEVPDGSPVSPRLAVGLASAGLAVTGGALWVAAGVQKGRFNRATLEGTPAENEAELQGYASSANRLSAVALGVSGLAVAGGVTFAVAF